MDNGYLTLTNLIVFFVLLLLGVSPLAVELTVKNINLKIKKNFYYIVILNVTKSICLFVP